MIPEPMDFLLLLLFLGLTACALGLVWPLLVALAQRAMWAIGDTWSDLSAGVDRTASSLRTEYRSARRRHEYMDWLEDMLNPNDSSPATDFDFLQAKQQWPAIRKLTQEELPKWIRRCVCTHRLAGFAAGATYMYEIALEPECFALRERVIGLEEACVTKLSDYALLLDSPELTQNLIVIRSRILPICRNCPYLQCRVDQAPLLCPSAEIVHLDPKTCEFNGNQS